MTLSKFSPFMAYLEPKQIVELRKFSKRHKTTMTQVVREALSAKLSSGDVFSAGFNSGVDRCMESISGNTGAQLRFPSGKSVAELLNDELAKLKMAEVSNESDG